MATRPGRSTDRNGLPETWMRMLSLFIEKRDAMFSVLGRHGLTPPHGHAMSMLAHGPAPMRDLAEHMNCDASYITTIVDRLEESGLAERRPSATDRRVKEIALTPRGEGVAAEIRDTMTTPPAVFARLSKADRATLGELLANVVPDVDPASDPFRPPHRHPPSPPSPSNS